MNQYTVVCQSADDLSIHVRHFTAWTPVQAALQSPDHCVALTVFCGWHNDQLCVKDPYPDALAPLADALNR